MILFCKAFHSDLLHASLDGLRNTGSCGRVVACMVMCEHGMQLSLPRALHKQHIGIVPDRSPWKADWLHKTIPCPEEMSAFDRNVDYTTMQLQHHQILKLYFQPSWNTSVQCRCRKLHYLQPLYEMGMKEPL